MIKPVNITGIDKTMNTNEKIAPKQENNREATAEKKLILLILGVHQKRKQPMTTQVL